MGYAIGAIITLILALAMTAIYRSRKRSGCTGFSLGLSIGALFTLAFNISVLPQISRPKPTSTVGLMATVVVEAATGTGEQVQESEVWPTLPPELSKAQTLCEEAFLPNVERHSSTPESPFCRLFKREYRDESWGYSLSDADPLEPSCAGVNAVICIREGREPEGRHSGGGVVYRKVWSVRLVDWHDGTVLEKAAFRGTPPLWIVLCPETNPDCDGYGDPPKEEFKNWFFGLIGKPDS